MKKQIGLIALSTLIIAGLAFSGVASAQSSGVQVYFFESPYCGVCNTVRPYMEAAAAQTGAHVTYYDMSTSVGAGIGKANGVTETPTIVIQGGQTLVGSVSEPQIVAAIEAAGGASHVVSAVTPSATPTPTATPTAVKAVVKATPTPYVAPKVVKATPTPYVAPKVVTAAKQPSIQVVTATQTPTTSTQTVPEFSLLGLGAPALLVGAIYLFLRRR